MSNIMISHPQLLESFVCKPFNLAATFEIKKRKDIKVTK